MVIHNSNTTRSRMSLDESNTRPSSEAHGHHHAHFEDLETGVVAAGYQPTAQADGNISPGSRSDTAKQSSSSTSAIENDASKISPIMMKRRATRVNTGQSKGTTVRTVKSTSAQQKGWHPGQEPGLDPTKLNGGRQQEILREQCQITIVDYSEDDMEMHDFDNQGFIDFIQKPQESWIKCRWININGISWDVIQAVAIAKKLHRLAIEDLTNKENRTKVDWYADHTFMIMTLHKLIHMHEDGEKDSDCSSDDEDSLKPAAGSSNRLARFLRRMVSGKPKKSGEPELVAGVHDPANGKITGHTLGMKDAPIRKLRTLQRYHGGPNEDRLQYMEYHSVLKARQKAVTAEQVSIFLTSDNTVISFFEASADDLELPILHRLSTPDTILRRSCDGSMLLQALIDAIIDLAIPVTHEYEDIIGDMELNVLIEPSLKHTTNLYIVTSEITKMRANISPTLNLINSLKDHKSTSRADEGGSIGEKPLQDATQKTVAISQMARTYLGDVEDHILLMTDSLDTMRRSCDNMIDLIFNTIAANQNESMKQLTVVTIIFLPLSFLTGYFGMNFDRMTSLRNGDGFFWKVAAPVSFVVALYLMKEVIQSYFKKVIQKRHISKNRKGRLSREAEEKRRQ